MPEKIDRSKVISVYSGINGKCCCGCSGKHYYASTKVEEGTKKRGYQVTFDEINDNMITRICNLIDFHLNIGDVEDLVSCLSVVIGKRVYITYFE